MFVCFEPRILTKEMPYLSDLFLEYVLNSEEKVLNSISVNSRSFESVFRFNHLSIKYTF